jgi:DNA polymerase delta subunit 2
MAALGMETSSGDFEVIDLCFAGLPELYKPTPGPSLNGKGKGKADDMNMDGKFHHATLSESRMKC